MKALKASLSIVGSICLIIALLGISTFCFAYNKAFIKGELDKYDVFDYVGSSKEDVYRVTDILIDFMSGKRDDLTAPATVKGTETDNFYNEDEILHMVDVRNIFLTVNVLVPLLLVLAAACYTTVFLMDKDLKASFKRISHGFLIGGGILLTLTLLLGIAIAVDFDAAFTKFHHLFFTNDLWLMNPATDNMIRMLPSELFMDAAVGILIVFAVLVTVFGAGLVVTNKILNKPSKTSEAAK